MKKMICLALAVLLAACLIPVLGEEAEASPLGDWYADLLGINLHYTLNEDGTYIASALGEEGKTGEWVMEDSLIYLNGDVYPTFFFPGEMLIALGDNLVFTREEAEARYTPAPVMENAPSFFFEGYWKCAYVEVNGFLAPADVLGEKSEIWIEADDPTIEQIDEETLDITFANAFGALGGERFGDVIVEFVYQDSAYVGKITGTDTTVTLQLLEDYMLKVTMESAEKVDTLYFKLVHISDQRIVEEE